MQRKLPIGNIAVVECPVKWPDFWTAPLASIRGVGPERAAQLTRLNLEHIGDLLLHRPRRYEDRRHMQTICDWPPGTTGLTRGHIVAAGIKRMRQRRQSLFECIVEDGTGRLHCRWWNLPYLKNQLHVDDELLIYGKLTGAKQKAVDHPEIEKVDADGGAGADGDPQIHLKRIVPIYPLTDGLPQRWLRSLTWRLLETYQSQIPELWPEPAVPARADAIRSVHFPISLDEVESTRARLALDELLELQVEIQRRRHLLWQRTRCVPCGGDNRHVKPFLKGLPFKLTESQTTVLRQIRGDLSGQIPMRRLLQGDVGSGKTVVSACAMLMAIESGACAVLMAPTEVLAEQHYKTFSNWLKPLHLNASLVTSGQRDDTATSGVDPDVIIGTHALLHDGMPAQRVGLVIIDEQHKFGVTQRDQLVQKGNHPHLLVMTATPIPRTLGLTLYGDLDLSVMDRPPADRAPVRTYIRTQASLPKVWKFVATELAAGRQAFIIYPRVDESGQDGLKGVTAEWEHLRAKFSAFQVGLVHGRLPRETRERVMDGFRGNEIQALVATTVVEVGVDVPNATVMVIENAEQFGLAQLHQLRGRIGRGPHPSTCILIANDRTAQSRQRLRAIAATSDGFELAEADLQLRGPGEFLGQQQSGLPSFRFTDLTRDHALAERARDTAKRWSQKGVL